MNEPKIDGKTALMIAVANNSKEYAELLIKHGADINVFSNEGKTALMYAIENGNKEIKRFLIDSGANR